MRKLRTTGPFGRVAIVAACVAAAGCSLVVGDGSYAVGAGAPDAGPHGGDAWILLPDAESTCAVWEACCAKLMEQGDHLGVSCTTSDASTCATALESFSNGGTCMAVEVDGSTPPGSDGGVDSGSMGTVTAPDASAGGGSLDAGAPADASPDSGP